MGQEDGWQISGDAPSYYMRYAYAMQEPWTQDLILQACCKDGDRVLDVACGPGLVAGKVNDVSHTTCKITASMSMKRCLTLHGERYQPSTGI